MVRLGLGNSKYLEKVRKKWWPWLKRNYWWLVVWANLLTNRLKCRTSSAPLITHIITRGHLSRKCKKIGGFEHLNKQKWTEKKSPKWMKLKMEIGHSSVDGNNKLFQHDDFWMSYNTEYFIVRESIFDNLDPLLHSVLHKIQTKRTKATLWNATWSCRVQLKIDFSPTSDICWGGGTDENSI